MRLTYISDYSLPTMKPEGQQGLKMCEAFAAESVDVTLLVPNRANEKPRPGTLEAYYGMDKLSYSVESYAPRELVLLRAGSGKTLLMQLPRARSMLAAVAAWRAKLSASDVCFTRSPLIAAFLSTLGQPVVLEMMTFTASRRALLIRSLLRAKQVRLVLTITEHMREDLEVACGANNKVRCLPIGVDVNQFRPQTTKAEARRRLGLSSTRPIAVYTGGLRPDRGVEVVVQAAAILPEVDLVLVGGREDEIARLRELALAQGVSNLIFAGYVEHSKVPVYQSAADVLLLIGTLASRHQARHASYAKLFEYMASGRPIVATDLPSISETLVHDQNALLVSPDSPDALASAIRSVLADTSLGARLADQALADVEQYSWGNRVRRILQWLEED